MKKQYSYVRIYGSSDEERFWLKVNKKSDDECWEWLAYLYQGYGRFSANKKCYFAHRYSWMLTFGEIPDGMLVCHKCDNPSCVNPSHLFLGTDLDNARDKIKKGRQQFKGEFNGRSILNSEAVKVIRYFRKDKAKSLRDLSKIYGVSVAQISLIANGKRWSHICV